MLVTPILTLIVSPAAAAPRPLSLDARPDRNQFGLVGSDSTVVWAERVAPDNPATENVSGTADIRGFDLATSRSFIISAAPGDQLAPAISGSTVVWQDTGHSCPTCKADIRGKNLSSGSEFDIATGSADQVDPAIAGNIVSWIQGDTAGERLMAMDLTTRSTSAVTVAPSGISLGRPVMSQEFIVWLERGEKPPYQLHSYDLANHSNSVVAKSTWLGTEYALSGHQLVWTDPRPNLVDLRSGNSSVLDQ